MLISFDTLNFNYETEGNINRFIITANDCGEFPKTETEKVTLENSIRLAIAKIVNGEN